MTQIPTVSEDISLPDLQKNKNPEVVCRTCTKQNNRLRNVSKAELIKRLGAGESRNDIMCQPTKLAKTTRVLETTKARGRIVPLNKPSKLRTRAFVDSCGQNLRKECRSCDRFLPVQTSVPYTKTGAKVYWTSRKTRSGDVATPVANDGSTIFRWRVTVGGRCSAPQVCDPQPRKVKLDNPSCANCQWLDYAGTNWQSDYLTVNEAAALTPWERAKALAGLSRDANKGLAIGRALKEKQSTPVGRVCFYRAELLKDGWHKGLYKYKVVFDDSSVTAVLADGDDRWTVYKTSNPKIVAVEIRYPHWKDFGLPTPLWKNPKRWPPLPEKGKKQRNLDRFIKNSCRECGSEPCFFHAKGPVRNDVTGEIEFTNPEGARKTRVAPPHGTLRLTEVDGDVCAVDGNGNKPEPYSETVANASVFRMEFSALTASARKKYGEAGVRAIGEQYSELVSKLRRRVKGTPMRPSWYINTGIEPSRPRCTHPLGLNLREMFQDSFGSERTNWEYDHGSASVMEAEEELRVGYRQHSQTPQRLQEEILANDMAHPKFDTALEAVPESNPIDVSDFKVKVIPGIGGMLDEDGEPVTSVDEFMRRLDEKVVISNSGEVDRLFSRRYQLFGYDLSRSHYGKKNSNSGKSAVPSQDNDIAIFDKSDEEISRSDWVCVGCEAEYSSEEIVDFYNPICSACGDNLHKPSGARIIPSARSTGGVGNVYIKDSPAAQQRRRLYDGLCENWTLKGSEITLVDISGPDLKDEENSDPEPVDVEVKVIRAQTLNLTEEQREHNKQYWAKNSEVTELRTKHLLDYPETSQADLIRKFPRPEGTIYQPAAAGSLAKMGSA